MSSDTSTEILELDRDECERLLASHQIGRLVATMPDATPLIRPVNYVWDGPSRSIILRTAPGTKLHAMLTSERVWFEVDDLDPDRRTGWSVIVTGRAEPIADAATLRRLSAGGPAPWAPGARPHPMRIRAVVVTGRRIARVC